MYKNEFQGGPAVDVFGANGKDPLNKWKNPAVHRIYEKGAKGYVYSLEGSTATAKLTFPIKEQFKQNLCLIQRYLVLQVYIPMSKDFAIELNMSDINNNKRRVLMSTSAKDISSSPLHAKLPLSVLKRDTWLNLCFDLVSLISDVFTSQTYKSLDSFTLQGNLKVRRVFTLKDPPRDTTTISDDVNSGVRCENIPISLQFSSAVSYETQVINVGKIRQSLGTRSTRSERDTSGYWSSSSEELSSSRRFSARDKLPTHIAFGTKVPFEPSRTSRSKSGLVTSHRDLNLPDSSTEGSLSARKVRSGYARLSGRSHSNEKINPRGPVIVPRHTKHKVKPINSRVPKKSKPSETLSQHLDADLPSSLLSLVDNIEDYVPEDDQTLTCFTFSSQPHSVPRLRTESGSTYSQNDKEHDFIRSSSSDSDDNLRIKVIQDTPSPRDSRSPSTRPFRSSSRNQLAHLTQPQSSLSPDISRLQSPPQRAYISSNYTDPPDDSSSLSHKPPLSRKSLRSSDATLTASMDTLVQHSSILSCEDSGPPIHVDDNRSPRLDSSEEKPLNSSSQSVVLKRKNIKSIPNPNLTLPESSGFEVGTWSESYEAEMLQSMKRENEEEMKREEEEKRLGMVVDFRDSMDESFGASWSTYKNPPPMPLRAYQDEMLNDPATINNSSLLDCSNPRDWAEMFSPPTVLPSQRTRQNKESLSGSDSAGMELDIMGLSDGSSTASMKSSATTDAEEEEMLDLMFDPCLNCYFDPKTGKYYELRN